MHRLLVEDRRWVSEERFLHALNYCMLLPGPEAQRLAVYLGWLKHGPRDGLAAGTLFILSGFLEVLVLGYLYIQGGNWAPVAIAFGALPAAVVGFVALSAFAVPFPIMVLGAAFVGPLGAMGAAIVVLGGWRLLVA
jgi:chromate transporter